jgi:hypothetical protein
MKKIVAFTLLVVIASGMAGCPGPTPPPANTVAEVPDTVTVSASNQDGDHIVWIGLFAQWKRTATENIDGSYDTTNHLFIACGQNTGETIDRSAIVLLSGSACDEAPGRELRLMHKPAPGKPFVEISSEIRITDTSSANPKASFQSNNKQKTILFDEATMNRIRNNKQVLTTHFQKN